MFIIPIKKVKIYSSLLLDCFYYFNHTHKYLITDLQYKILSNSDFFIFEISKTEAMFIAEHEFDRRQFTIETSLRIYAPTPILTKLKLVS